MARTAKWDADQQVTRSEARLAAVAEAAAVVAEAIAEEPAVDCLMVRAAKVADCAVIETPSQMQPAQ